MDVTAGIDVGSKTVKAAIVRDGEVLGTALLDAGFDNEAVAERALISALKDSGLTAASKVSATGTTAKNMSIADGYVSEIHSATEGVTFFYPGVRTILSVGAEQSFAISVDEKGFASDFVINDKCAAGVGTFIEAMARVLEVSPEKLGELAMASKDDLRLNAQCVVFAESEVVSLLHSNVPKETIAKGVMGVVAEHIALMVRRCGSRQRVAFVGGMARNKGLVDIVARELGVELFVPADGIYTLAIGAALVGVNRK